MSFYSDLWWRTNGIVAASTTAHVFPRNSTVLASLFSDAALTVPLANPLLTSAVGILTFFAAPGDYWIHIQGLTFDVTLSDGIPTAPGVWQATYEHTQVAPASTWIISHKLGIEPQVDVIISGGIIAITQVTHIDDNNVSLLFQSGPQTGTAFLRR
ncbi:MAG: hypothetical protein ACREIE_00585 [Nitrospiraceae bacterium]